MKIKGILWQISLVGLLGLTLTVCQTNSSVSNQTSSSVSNQTSASGSDNVTISNLNVTVTPTFGPAAVSAVMHCYDTTWSGISVSYKYCDSSDGSINGTVTLDSAVSKGWVLINAVLRTYRISGSSSDTHRMVTIWHK